MYDCNIGFFAIWKVLLSLIMIIKKNRAALLFLAVQTFVWDSSIPTPVTDWLTEEGFYFLTLESNPRDLRPLRHLVRVMRRHDLTKKNLELWREKKFNFFLNFFWTFFKLFFELFLNIFWNFFGIFFDFFKTFFEPCQPCLPCLTCLPCLPCLHCLP